MERTNYSEAEEKISQWVALSQKGDIESFGELVKMVQKQAYGLAFSILHHHQDAEDVSQEAFVQAFKKLGSFEPTGSFAAWLLKIVANMAKNKIRWRNLRQRLTFSMDKSVIDAGEEDPMPRQVADLSPEADPSAQMEKSSSSEKMTRALKKLSHQQSTAIHLKCIQGYKISEVAAAMGLSEGTVKTHLFRGIDHLKKIVQEEPI